MKKRYKILLSIVLPIICITTVFSSFLLPRTKAAPSEPVIENTITAEDTGASTADKSKKGGALYIEKGATYTMKGGSINARANVYGGAVYVASGATFNMEGGTISGCEAKYGGAIYIESGGEVNITNGTITGNFAENAPAIYVEDGAVLNVDEETLIEDNLYKKWYTPLDYISADKTVIVGNPSVNFSLPYIDFGSYPQWYVGDEMNETLENWYNSSSPNEINTYKVRGKTWIFYQYIDGNIYARGSGLVYSNEYTYLSGELVKPEGVIVWFKVEPIRWLVLNYQEIQEGTTSSVELMSYTVLVSNIYFNNTNVDKDGLAGTSDDPNQWVNSFMRRRLNTEFYNSAFTKSEKNVIFRTTIGNNITGDYSSETSNSSGVATQDNVYLISAWDIEGSGKVFDNSKKRACSPTDFALNTECIKHTNSERTTDIYLEGGTCYYWVRSAGIEAFRSCIISPNGFLCDNFTVTISCYGVRPVIRISI